MTDIKKLVEIRNNIKNLITEYNTISGSDVETRVMLLTYGMHHLYTQEQIDAAFDESMEDDNNYGTIDGEYIEQEGVSAFGDEDGWLPSSLFC